MEQLGFLNVIFDKFKGSGATVAINISSRSVLEVMEIDMTGLIVNYSNTPIQYNSFTKAFENISDFSAALKRTFSEMNLSLSSKIYLCLPTFVIETGSFPVLDDAEAIKTILTSEVEKNYFFKKYDPAISYYKSPEEQNISGSMNLAYTALRHDEYVKIVNAISELGLKIVAIDSSYSALINGVIKTQKVNPAIIEQDANWNIITITSNSFTIFAMRGKNLENVYEEPLAVKSFTEEEVYQVITNSLELVIDKFPSEQNIIVSQSDEVSAEYLSKVLNFNTHQSYIEDNKYRQQLVEVSYNVTQSYKNKITLEAVGLTTWPFNHDGLKFNFFESKSSGGDEEIATAVVESLNFYWNGREVELTPNLLFKWILIGFMLVSVVLGIICYFLKAQITTYTKQQDDIAVEIANIENELKLEPKTDKISEEAFLQNAYQNNLNYKKSYGAIAQEIPNMLWIEELQLSDDSKVYIHGRSYKMDDILNYYDSLSKLGKFQDLKISLLKVSNTPISDLLLNNNSTMLEETTYEFAFGNRFFVDPRATLTTGETKDGATTPAGNATSTTDVAPPPTNIPKQDN